MEWIGNVLCAVLIGMACYLIWWMRKVIRQFVRALDVNAEAWRAIVECYKRIESKLDKGTQTANDIR